MPRRSCVPCSDFSGGWRMRVALAGVLFAQPDLLLLDEPTNYLDLEGALWLESYLAKYPHTVLIISHDRGLLNRAVQGILHLDRQQADLLDRPLRPVRPPDGRTPRRAAGRGEEAGGAPRASAKLRRPLQGQGVEGRAGAVPRQDAGKDDADHRRRKRRRSRSSPSPSPRNCRRRSSTWMARPSAMAARRCCAS